MGLGQGDLFWTYRTGFLYRLLFKGSRSIQMQSGNNQMEYEYTLTVDADILIAQSKGIISSIAVLVEFNQRAFKEARKRGIRKILRDHRKTRWTLDFHDVVLFSDIMMAIPEHSQRSKNVTVFSQSDCFVGRMFETAAINRSLNYRPFVDYEKAVNWLNKGAPSGNAYCQVVPCRNCKRTVCVCE